MTIKLKYSIFLFCALPIAVSAGNFYAGVDMGYQDYNLNSKITTQGPIGNFTTNSYSKLTSSGNGVRGGLFAGYESRLPSNLYLGGEMRGSISNTQINAQSQGTANSAGSSGSENVTGTLRENESVDIRFKPGYFLTDSTVAYVFLGYVAGRVKISGNVNASLVTSSGVNNLSINTPLSKTGWVHGFQFGIGTQVYVNQNWALRSELRQVNYNTVKFRRTSATLKGTPNITEGSIGFVWIFC